MSEISYLFLSELNIINKDDDNFYIGEAELSELLLHGKYNEKIQEFIAFPTPEIRDEIIQLVNFIFQDIISLHINFINKRILTLNDVDIEKIK